MLFSRHSSASRTIIIMHINPLLNRNTYKLLVGLLIKEGYDLEYWNVHSIAGNSRTFVDEISESYVRVIESTADFHMHLAKLTVYNTIFIIGFQEYVCPVLYQILQKKRFYIMHIGLSPSITNFSIKSIYTEPSMYFSYLKELIRKRNIVINILYQSLTKKNWYNSVVLCYDSQHRTDAINSPDYDHYQVLKVEQERVNNQKYILFLDQYFPLHPEQQCSDRKRGVLALEYQKTMCDFFSKAERKHQMPVVIAAHPSSDYTTKVFAGRSIIKNNTARLVRDAEIVITHISTSTVYAVLWNKPIVFVRTAQMKLAGSLYHKMKLYANYFGKECHDAEKANAEDIEWSMIRPDLRDRFIYSQLTTPENENKSNSEILLSVISSNFNRMEQWHDSNVRL